MSHQRARAQKTQHSTQKEGESEKANEENRIKAIATERASRTYPWLHGCGKNKVYTKRNTWPHLTMTTAKRWLYMVFCQLPHCCWHPNSQHTCAHTRRMRKSSNDNDFNSPKKSVFFFQCVPISTLGTSIWRCNVVRAHTHIDSVYIFLVCLLCIFIIYWAECGNIIRYARLNAYVLFIVHLRLWKCVSYRSCFWCSVARLDDAADRALRNENEHIYKYNNVQIAAIVKIQLYACAESLRSQKIAFRKYSSRNVWCFRLTAKSIHSQAN